MDEQMMYEEKSHWDVTQIVVVVIVLAVLLGIALGLYQFGFFGEKTENLEDGVVRTTAREGSLVRTFPVELILDPSADIRESYSLNYTNDAVNLPAVTFTTELSYEEIIQRYEDYFAEHEYTGRIFPDVSENPTSYYGEKDGVEVQVVFVDREGTVEVTVSRRSIEG